MLLGPRPLRHFINDFILIHPLASSTPFINIFKSLILLQNVPSFFLSLSVPHKIVQSDQIYNVHKPFFIFLHFFLHYYPRLYEIKNQIQVFSPFLNRGPWHKSQSVNIVNMQHRPKWVFLGACVWAGPPSYGS